MTDSIEVRINRDIDALKELLESRAWTIIREMIENEKMVAVTKMGSPILAVSTDYLRGMIFAAERLKQMPENLINQLEAELLPFKALAAAGAGGSTT